MYDDHIGEFCPVYFGEQKIEARGKQVIGVYGRCVIEALDEVEVWAYGETEIAAYDKAEVHAHNKTRILAQDEVRVWLHSEAEVWAQDKANVVAYDQSRVHASGKVVVLTRDKTMAFLDELATVTAYNEAQIYIDGEAHAIAHNETHIFAQDKAHVLAYDKSTVHARHEAQVTAYGEAAVFTDDENRVEAHEGVTVELRAPDVIVKAYCDANVEAHGGTVYAAKGANINRQGGRVVEWDGFSPIPGWGDDSHQATPEPAQVEPALPESDEALTKITEGQPPEVKDESTEGEKQDQANAAIDSLVKDISKTACDLTKQQIAAMIIEARAFTPADDPDYEKPGSRNRDCFWWLLRKAGCKTQAPIRDVWNGLTVMARESLGDNSTIGLSHMKANKINTGIRNHDKRLPSDKRLQKVS